MTEEQRSNCDRAADREERSLHETPDRYGHLEKNGTDTAGNAHQECRRRNNLKRESEADENALMSGKNAPLYYCSADAKALVRAFIQEKLDGDLQKFKEFDIKTLKDDPVFGCTDPRYFDGDNTYIMRAVYVLLWSGVFPRMTDWREIDTGKYYRGDTIHTFYTIFGRSDPAQPGHFFGIDRFAPVDEALYERIRRFHNKVRTLGNFVVLPNCAVKTDAGFLTLNTYRGTNHWHDYIDRFLLALEPCLSCGDRSDETLYKLVHERNKYAFADYKGPGGFTRLVKALLLDDYLDADGRAVNFYADAGGRVRFHWDRPQVSRETYLQGVVNYLDHAEKIISQRADRMIEMLKESLG